MRTDVERPRAQTAPSDGPSFGDRLATWVFVALVVGAAPLVLFRLGSFHWFLADDWAFLTSGKIGSAADLFRPHNAHWSTITFVEYRLLWNTVGLKSYVPYQAVLLITHLAVVVMLRVVALRAGVRPWIATAMAAALMLFGPGSDDIVWAFQIGFTGALAFGLGQLLLTDHDGPLAARDFLGVAAGLLALMCSGVGVAMATVAGIAVLLRRGWKIALLQTVPLGVGYAIYALAEHPQVSSPTGRPSIGTILRWLVNAQEETFGGLGRYQPVAIALFALLIAGFALAWVAPASGGTSVARRHRLAGPTALLAGGVIFAVLTAQGRWQFGVEAARAGRYTYLGAAFTLPALAVAADELARRRRELLFVGLALLLVGIPANAATFQHAPFDREYFDRVQHVLVHAPRMPFAADVPAAVTPLAAKLIPPDVNMGFLRRALRDGRLPGARGPFSSTTLDEFRVRLGFAQFPSNVFPVSCRKIPRPLRVNPKVGTVMRFTTPIVVSLAGSSRSPRVAFQPQNGQLFVTELADLHLVIAPAGASSFTQCDPP